MSRGSKKHGDKEMLKRKCSKKRGFGAEEHSGGSRAMGRL